MPEGYIMKHNKEKYGYGGSHSFRYAIEYIIGVLGTFAVPVGIILLCVYIFVLGRYS